MDHMNEQFAIYARVEDAIVAQRSLLDSYRNGRNVGLMVDEWGVWDRILPADEKAYGKLWQQSTMRSAVAAGLGLNIFNRHAEKLYMRNIAQMVNVLQSLILTDGPEGEHCVVPRRIIRLPCSNRTEGRWRSRSKRRIQRRRGSRFRHLFPKARKSRQTW